MSVYAIINAGVVAQLLTPPGDATIEQCLPAGLAVTVDVTTVSPQPQPGWTATETNGSWAFAPPAAPPASVPQQITIFQCKAWLLSQAGAEQGKTLLDDVNAWVTAQGGLMLLAWNEATVVTRNGQFVTAAMAHFGWPGSLMDTAFTAAAQIQA